MYYKQKYISVPICPVPMCRNTVVICSMILLAIKTEIISQICFVHNGYSVSNSGFYTTMRHKWPIMVNQHQNKQITLDCRPMTTDRCLLGIIFIKQLLQYTRELYTHPLSNIIFTHQFIYYNIISLHNYPYLTKQ